MPIPRRVARFNRYVTNPLARLVAAWLPPFALVVHRGRISGRWFSTPVWAFRTNGGYVIALTYGAGAQWVRNVLEAGGCTMRTRGRRFDVIGPEVVTGPAGIRLVPRFVRAPLRMLNATEFLHLPSRPSPNQPSSR